jgi:uncharacterized GH25 family protein
MWRMLRITLLTVPALAAQAGAHFTMLLPSAEGAKKGEAITILCQWGHPFEHQLFDAPPPVSLTVRTPAGKKLDLTDTLEKVEVASGDKKATAYRLQFMPEARGDFVFVLRMPPFWMEEEAEFYEDTAQVVLHVQAQKGWDAVWPELAWEPLTRPYGLHPGVAFQARVAPQPGTRVEVELYNPQPPPELPPDEQITRTAKTDPNGVVTATLPEAGWWCLAASAQAGMRERDGKSYAVRRRSILWVHVAERSSPR